MAEADSIPYLVVIGSSAGGIDALVALLSGLPSDFKAPIVIAQHLDPNRISHLNGILERRSPIPVRTVTDQEQLAPATVYVVPSNRHVSINDHHITLTEDSNQGSKPSIDLLFSSASEAFGERLIAVILSGMGSDGAIGARVVKEAGGTVIIQDPKTAAFPSMPSALAPTSVDIYANVHKIGAILSNLVAGIGVPKYPEEQRQLTTFLDEIRERYGIDFNQYKPATIMRRLQRRIVATDSDNVDSYIQYLRANPEEYQQLINAFLIKVTEFFRDGDLFEYLRDTIVPELVAQSRKRGNELRIWTAGCATGEEAYSIAIILAEVLGPTMEHFSIRIFATDADANAVAFARRGVYPASALEHMPEDLVTRYFTKDNDSYQVRKRVRSLTIFGQHDLGGRAPFPNIDLILCRNVLIYFTAELQQRTFRVFAYSLRNDGYLVLGKAETAGALSESFVPVHRVQKVYRRHGDRILLPASRMPSGAPLVPLRNIQARQESVRRSGQITRENTTQRADALLMRLPVGVVVVNRRYDIQVINGAARGFLSIYGTAIGEDLIHIAQGVPQQNLREAIDEAFRTNKTVTIEEVPVVALTNSASRYLKISCHPQMDEVEAQEATTVMLVVHDISTPTVARREAERQLQITEEGRAQELQLSAGRSDEREQMVRRLVNTNRQLMEANQELTNTNEELHTMNEEFMVNVEEAQAAIEEVETLNEEMQATNEELETLNEELQATIEELNTTNDDLNARSNELLEMAQNTEHERALLDAILRSLGDAVLVVDAAGTPLRSNAAYARMFTDPRVTVLAAGEKGQPLAHDDMPLQRTARGETFSMEFTVTQPDGSRRWYEANGGPLVVGDGAGGVVAIRDITDRSLHRMQDEFMAMAGHELRTPLTALQGSLQLLQRGLAKQPAETQAIRLTELSLRQVSRLTRLVTDLLDVRRLQSGKFSLVMEPFDLGDVVTRAVDAAKLLHGAKPIRVHMTDTPLRVNGDAGRIEQVILNLLTNAMVHAPDGKHVDVLLRHVEGNVEVQVKDGGKGIDAAELPHIFSLFFQLEHGNAGGRQGLGLGLYIAKEIIDAHGGTISVDSTVGRGTTFTIRLAALQD